MLVSAINKTDAEHLAAVIEDMKIMGAPTIRVYNNGGEIVALEGSHRLAAAKALGLIPVIVEMDENDEMVSDLDIIDEETGSFYGANPVPVSLIVDCILSSRGFNHPCYDFGGEDE